MLRKRFGCLISFAGFMVLIGPVGGASAVEVAEGALRQQIAEVVTAAPLSLPPKIAELRAVAIDRLVLETHRLSWREGRLSWALRRARKLTADERVEALKAVDGLLRYALGETPGRNTDHLFSADEARRAVDQSRLSILDQPYIWEISHSQIQQALRRASQDPSQRAKLNRMRGEFEIPDFDNSGGFGFENGVVTLRLSPNMRGHQEPQLPRFLRFFSPERQQRWLNENMEKQNREFAAKARRYEDSLRSFVTVALGEIPDPDLDMPLLDPQDAKTLPVRIEVHGLQAGAAMGAAGVPLVRSSASRGAVRRTIRKIRYEGIYQSKLWLAELDYMRATQYPVDGPPQLVIDTGAFSGAVVNKVALSPDGRYLAAAGDVVRIWELDGGRLLHTLRGQKSWDSSGGCTDLVFTPDGRQLLVTAAGFDRCLRVYDIGAPDQPREVHQGHDGHIERLAISRDGQWLVTYGIDRRMQIWNWPNREIVATYPANDSIDHLSFPTARANLFVLAGNGNYEWMHVADGVTVNSRERGILENKLTSGRSWPYGGAPHPFAIALDWNEDRWLIAGFSRGNDRDHYWCGYWTGDGREPQAVYEPKYYVTACDLSADGRWAATADALGNVAVWNTETGETRHLFASRIKPVYSVSYERDNRRIDFGRIPYDKSRWGINHYGPLTQSFDLRQRALQRRQEADPPAAITAHDEYRLRLRVSGTRTQELVMEDSSGAVHGSLPFSSATRLLPLWYSFLTGISMGFENGVILGSEDGSLVCLDPHTMLSQRVFIGHTDRVWSASQSADDGLLASGAGDGTIRVWQLEPPRDWGNLAVLADDDGKVHHVFPGTPTARVIRKGDFITNIDGRSIYSVRQNFSATKQWKYKAGDRVDVEIQRGTEVFNREIELSRTGDVGQPLFSLFITADEKDWVIWTPQGYYDASPGGHRLIGWHVNRGTDQAADFFPVEEFREKFYRPLVIDALLRLNDLQLALQEVEREHVSAPPKPADVVDEKPRVKIVSPAGDLITGDGEIEIVAEITAPKNLPIHDTSVLVNGKPIQAKDIESIGPAPPQPNASGYSINSRNKPSQQTYRVRHTVQLDGGTNEISLIAGSADAHSRAAAVMVNYRSSLAPQRQPRLFVLAVGISDYRDDEFDLKFAAADAQEFAAICKRQPKSQYALVETRVLCDEAAVESAIEDGMDWLVEQVDDDDVGVLLLCGHGVMDEQQNFYFATHDMDRNRLRSTCLRWSSIHDLARDLSGRFVLFADTCHAGGLMSVTTIVGDPVGELARDDIGAIVYASCGARATSYEDARWGHGAFTKALLDTLGSKTSDRDTPPDGQLSLSELEHNLDRRVRVLTGEQQRPVSARPAPMSDRNLFALFE